MTIDQEISAQRTKIEALSKKLDDITDIYELKDALNILEIKILEQEFQRNQVKNIL